MIGRRTAGSLFATLAFSVALLSSAPAATPVSVSCGETITADTTLANDLLDCPNNGIVIGADDITLDLNGHTVDGDNELVDQCPEDELCDTGVANEGHDGVTVQRGSVNEFVGGVFIAETRESRVVGISASSNSFFGAVVVGSTRGVVRNSSLGHSLAPDGDGIGVFGSDHIRIVRNSIRDNPQPGIHIDGSTDNLIKGNTLAHNGPSILIEADENEVRGNRISGGAGILVGPGRRNVIAGNRITRAEDSIGMDQGSHNLLARNFVVDARGTGIGLGMDRPPLGGDNNVVRRNRVKNSSADAFRVYAKETHSVLRRNVAIGAADDGFEVESGATRLTGNHATRNRGFGIVAVRRVGDGGGNVARRNGHHPQCIHIACE
jgi:parallel beta-helix repeat protein